MNRDGHENVDSPTFCAAPWMHLRSQNTGEFRVCCNIQPELTEFSGRTQYNISQPVNVWRQSEYMNYVRTSLSNGVRLAECKKCWAQDTAGAVSYRKTMNNILHLDHSDAIIDINQDTLPSLRYVDLSVGNACNLSCLMCSPQYSSLIHKKYQTFDLAVAGPTIKHYRDHEYHQVIADTLHNTTGLVKFIGGEPLINSVLLNMLVQLPHVKQKNIRLHFVTNGTVDMVSVKRTLANFKGVSFSVSVDGIGTAGEFIREGSKWADIERNIISAKEAGLELILHSTIQAYNIATIWQVVDWCNTHDVPLSYEFLTHPAQLSVGVFSGAKKNTIARYLKSRLSGVLHQSDMHGTLSSSESIVSIFEQIPSTEEHWEGFLDQLAFDVKHHARGIDILTSIPEILKDCYES